MPPAERTQAGYRLFTAGGIAVLRFIRQAKTPGLRGHRPAVAVEEPAAARDEALPAEHRRRGWVS